jgi:hypothetical protein
LAEREGFEPSIRCRIHTFQACAFDHSAISPTYSPTQHRKAIKDNTDWILLQCLLVDLLEANKMSSVVAHYQLGFHTITSVRDKKKQAGFCKKRKNITSDIKFFHKNLPTMKLTQLFCDVDDFCQAFILEWQTNQLTNGEKKRNRPHRMSFSEMITLLLYYHQFGYRTFKRFYQNYVQKYWLSAFHNLLSYNRFIELISQIAGPLAAFMKSRCGTSQGIALIDSTPLCVCKNSRIPRHKTFVNEAGRGKSSTGWFYGFK